nr:DUF4952 domain-containing protein [Janthinobacterium sp. BJB401]
MPVQRTKLLPWLYLLGAELACGDFLSRLGKKPAYLVYQGCQQNRERHEVGGKHAQQTEAYLRRCPGGTGP